MIPPGSCRAGLLILCLAVMLPARAHPPCRLVLTASEWLSPNIIRVPFTLTGTLITVRARVDTFEGNFFFDTGASGLVLNARHFGRPARRVATAGSVTGLVRVFGASSIDTFQLDNLLLTDAPAEIIDLSHIENAKKLDLVGLIGYDVFKDFEVLFDYSASLLMLVRTDARGQPLEPVPSWEYKALGSVPVRMASHVAMVRLAFAPKTVRWFALDSGAEQNLLSVHAGKRFLAANFDIRRRFKLMGAGQAAVEVLGGVLSNARIDTFALRPMATLLTDLREINKVYETEVDGVLGYEFLAQRPVGINFRQRRLTFYAAVRP